jgi:hypothetical protein
MAFVDEKPASLGVPGVIEPGSICQAEASDEEAEPGQVSETVEMPGLDEVSERGGPR